MKSITKEKVSNQIQDQEEYRPAYKVYKFGVQCSQPVIESIQLLSFVMEEFKDMTPHEVDSVVQWFFKNYAIPKV